MSNKNINVKVFVSCHKPTAYISDSVFQPVQVGCNLDGHSTIEGILHDNVGENISSLNEMYCELTAQYWAWKNWDLDYYGFCHYRRYFNLTDTIFPEDSYGNIIEPYISEKAIKKYGIDSEHVEKTVQNYDLVTTEIKDLDNIPGDFKNPFEQYAASPFLHSDDYDLALEIIREKYPQYYPYALEFTNGGSACFCNMYILRKDLFFQYCEFMFGVLREFCSRCDMTHYSTEALRTPGHLSERLFNIYLLYLKDSVSDIRIKELQCVMFMNTDPHDRLLPAYNENSIPIVFAANNAYIPMFAAAFKSLISHSSKQYNYDVVVIGTDISEINKIKLVHMAESYTNITIRFYNPGVLIQNYNLKANAHITKETYYRFLIQDILPEYDKVLYLDSDLIINADLAELYQTDISNYMLAAARDPDFLGQINGMNPETMNYVTDVFKMKDPYNYFQAGVLLFNEKRMRDAYTLNQWLEFATKPYKYNDQDVLNLYCENEVYFLDMSWNMITDCNHERISKVIVFAPHEIQKEYNRARKAPKIIHYAGFKKPWDDPTEDFGEYFWLAERETPFYEELISNMSSIRKGLNSNLSDSYSKCQKIRRRTRLVNFLFPYGTSRRDWLDKKYTRYFQR